MFGVRSARWPDGPRQSGVAHGSSLIPVSGVVDENKTRSRHLPMSGREICQKMADECARLQRKMRTQATVETVFARNQFPDARMNMHRLFSSLTISPTTFGLAIFLLATLATVENFPNCLEFHHVEIVMTKKRMKSVLRSASANSG